MPERDPLMMAMFAAWVNTDPDKIPAEYRFHTCQHTLDAWQRVADAARAFIERETRP